MDLLLNITNTTNILGSSPSFGETCVLNQMSMINQLQKMPGNVVIIMLIALLALVSYIFFVPMIKESWRSIACNSLVTLATTLIMFAIIIQSAFTFNISEYTWLLIRDVLIIFFVLWMIIYSFINRVKIKNYFKEVRL